MKPSEALAKASRDEIVRIVEANRARNPRVFGSVLHGQDREGSDLDVLVDEAGPTDLYDLASLANALESLLGVEVDVRTPGDLSPRFREQVVAEARAL